MPARRDEQQTGNLEKACGWLQAMGHPMRLMIICLLRDRECNAADLAVHCDAPLATVLWHLKILEKNALVAWRKKAGRTFYRTADKRLPALVRHLLLNDWQQRNGRWVNSRIG